MASCCKLERRWLAFVRAVIAHRTWRPLDKLSLLRAAAGWLAGGFRCADVLTVAQLTRGVRTRIQRELIEPLCVAALNTGAHEASAQVFLRVIADTLFGGRGACDLLLPRLGLGDLLPTPAARWLDRNGATIRLRYRVRELTAVGTGWSVDGETFDRVVLAATAQENARLVATIAPAWADTASAIPFAPIVTVYLRNQGAVLPGPMLSLSASADQPAQFVFDRGQLSGADRPAGIRHQRRRSVGGAGGEAALEATRFQAEKALGAFLRGPLEMVQVVTEKRATFRCTPALRRPTMRIAMNLWAAGDYVEGPYPSTLEGAVRAGIAAGHARQAHGDLAASKYAHGKERAEDRHDPGARTDLRVARPAWPRIKILSRSSRSASRPAFTLRRPIASSTT